MSKIVSGNFQEQILGGGRGKQIQGGAKVPLVSLKLTHQYTVKLTLMLLTPATGTRWLPV